MGCRHYFVVDFVEDLVGEGGSICLTSSQTRQFSACFTTECGNLGILKSMSTSFNIERSDCEQTTDLTVLCLDLGLVGLIGNFLLVEQLNFSLWLSSNF